MPELPEVEILVRGLNRSLPGRRILSVRLGKTDFMDNPAAIERELPGLKIAGVARRGKYIVLGLRLGAADGDGAGADSALVVHLGMTGHLSARPAGEPPAAHTHAQFALDDGRELRYTDPRRFGRILWLAQEALPAFRNEIGIEPLTTSESAFSARIAGRHAGIKALLLNQRVLGGLGNIYTDESLWRARIHPQRLASRLKRAEMRALWRAIRRVLEAAIRSGGSTVSDYRNADGQPGWFQLRHRVYQREGKPCFRCRSNIRRIVVAGRSSHFCPQCQRAPRKRRFRGPTS